MPCSLLRDACGHMRRVFADPCLILVYLEAGVVGVILLMGLTWVNG